MNEQLANISVLEGIQAQANESMGSKPSACGMSVFNSAEVDKEIKEFDRASGLMRNSHGMLIRRYKLLEVELRKNVDAEESKAIIQDMRNLQAAISSVRSNWKDV